MAQEVEQLPGAGGRTPVDSYPWHTWLRPGRRFIQRGVDFHVAVTAMRAYTYRMAARHGVTVGTVRSGDRLFLEIPRNSHATAACPDGCTYPATPTPGVPQRCLTCGTRWPR